MVTIQTHSSEETEALGRALATFLPEEIVVALIGDLATGKTCLVRGMAAHFAGDDVIHSPTFTLVNEYGPGPCMYHMDLYRLDSVAEVADLGYEELFEPRQAITVVEWAERALPLLPEKRLEIHLEHGGGDIRKIRIENHGALPDKWHNSFPVPKPSVVS